MARGAAAQQSPPKATEASAKLILELIEAIFLNPTVTAICS